MKTVFFDLDGTLLPLDQDEFVKYYFYELGQFLEKRNYPKELILKAVYLSIDAMINNDGSMTNKDVFAKKFTEISKMDYHTLENEFMFFYEKIFDNVKKTTTKQPLAKEVIEILKDKGYQLILSTNPLFPRIATIKRILWAGLNPEDFSYITTFENSCFCKPNIKYYEEIITKFNLQPQDIIMVGNNVEEDMIVEELGIKTFLVTDYIINQNDEDISKYHAGDFNSLFTFVKSLPSVG